MRIKGLVVTGLAFAMGATAYAGVKTLGIGFGAPTINGETNVSEPERGAIFLDTGANPPVFKGNRGTPTSPDWTPLSTTTTPLPSGMVIMTAATSCPSGMLPTDGSSLTRVDHANLFAAIGTTYGSDDADHFNVPNTGGVFVRGAGSQSISSITYSGTQGTTQGDQLQGHVHAQRANNQAGVLGGAQFWSSSAAMADLSSGVKTDIPTSDGTNGIPRTGDETRPANIVLRYCIAD